MAAKKRHSLLFWVGAVAAFASAFVPGCYDRREGDNPPPADQACASCHGDRGREGTLLEKAAPPRDLNGHTSETDTSVPGIGAHWYHLKGSETHLAIPCAECHLVPKAVGDAGHADTDRPAEVPFATEPGTIAKTGGRSPSYDPETGRCSDTYCHRDSDATWTQPRSSADACGTCHAIPPALPHPQVGTDKCFLCHGMVVDKNLNFVNAALHVNGEVNVGQLGCDGCHGDPDRVVDPGKDLLKAAPPKDLAGDTAVSALGVGAHQAHLAGGANSRPVECTECHIVPSKVEDPGHTDTAAPAELTFSGTAAANGRTPSWDRTIKKCSNTWCHGPTAAQDSPEWTSEAGNLACTGCHGQPPPFPHPQMKDCSRCHGAVMNTDNVTIKDKSLHVNGTVDVVPLTQCTDCHGTPGKNPAPPVDLAGNTSSDAVGAHQSHLNPLSLFKPVPCETCHVVPASWDASGHIDTFLPAEVTFSGTATLDSSTPTYANGQCDNTYCHAAKVGGTIPSPKGTQTDGSIPVCGTCHGMPPQKGFHLVQPPATNCPGCHVSTYADWSLHVNGQVDL